MNKILRNLALAAVVAAPCTAIAEVAGTGTEADPYIIATAADLQECWKLTKPGETVYFSQTADIDMTGVTEWHAFAGWDYNTYTSVINYNGNNHVIKNFTNNTPGAFETNYTSDGYAGSIFGVLIGTVKNLGIVDVNITSGMGAGALGGYGGHAAGAVTIENVYATGKIKGSYYAGGLFGTMQNEINAKNCFVNIEVEGTAANRQYAAFVGRTDKAVNLENCYAAGTITTPEGNAVSGLICGGGAGSLSVNGVVAFNTGVTATSGVTCTGDITLANTEATKDAGLTEVKGWAAYSSTETIDGYPAFKYALQGSGTEADPYLIATAQDLCAIWTYTGTHNKDTFYFKQTADIDMLEVEPEDWHAALGFDGKYSKAEGEPNDLATIHYDGDNHLIKNFAGRTTTTEIADNAKNEYYGGSLFGVFTGTIKNLGVVDADVQASQTLGIGILGGYGSYMGESKIENVFVTGKVNGGASYCGGMFGTMAGNKDYQVTFVNCYVNAEIEGTSFAGGFMGRIDGPVAMENCYAAGTVAKNDNSGLILGNKRDGKPFSADMLNVIAFNTGAEIAIPFAVAEGSEEVTVATEATEAELIETVQGWDGYQDKLYKGYPALEWQTADLSGIRDIAIDEVEANGPAVYYNLQGVQVANPENGIYIVRRGNKVTKEIVR